jgi:hypothetical protein
MHIARQLRAKPLAEIPASQFKLIGGLTFPGVRAAENLISRDRNNIMPRIGFTRALDQHGPARRLRVYFRAAVQAQRCDSVGFSQTRRRAVARQRSQLVATLGNRSHPAFLRRAATPSGRSPS